MSEKLIEVTQIRSSIGRNLSHKGCLKGLGIKRMHQSVKIVPTKENLGMIAKISYMLKVEV